MTAQPDTNDSPSKSDFEPALRTLVLESFAAGAPVEGTWAVTSRSSIVPAWRVTIEKTDSADLPEDGATFLDE